MKISATELAYITSVAKDLKIEPATLLAVIEIESNGVVYANVEGQNLPVIRWEGHYFDRLVPADKRDVARKAGLASPKVGGIPNPATQVKRYDILDRARSIDEEAAYSSISIGVGQVMGSHAKDLGFASAEAMFQHAAKGLGGQVDLMVAYIKDNDLVDELQRKDWSAFARGYNGPAYRKFGYHTKLANAYKRYAAPNTPIVIDQKVGSEAMLRMGSEGQRVREIQTLLGRAGFAVKVDGDFGPSTKDAVQKLQKAHKLDVDGVVGPKTMAVLQTFKTAPDEKVGQVKPLDVKGVQTGAIVVAAGTAGLVVKNSLLGSLTNTGLVMLGIVVIVVGAALAIDAYNKAKRTYEGTET